eukprot:6998221-Alexandrium_andersonii.AAC.1
MDLLGKLGPFAIYKPPHQDASTPELLPIVGNDGHPPRHLWLAPLQLPTLALKEGLLGQAWRLRAEAEALLKP